MREKNLVRRRYCRDRVTVSELFFQGLRRRWRNKERGAEGLKMGTREQMGDCEEFFVVVRASRRK